MKRTVLGIFILSVILCSCQQSAKHNNETQNSETAQDTLAKVPRPDHIVIVIEENHGYNQIVGSKNAAYINKLIDEGALFTDAHGVTHPSQPNYIALFSGDTHSVKDDKCLQDETPYTSPNLGASLLQHGFTFKGYAQTMPSAGYLECQYKLSDLTKAYLYARKHVPWADWQGTKKNNIPDSLSQPMTQFPSNFDSLPNVAFVIPDQDHDMHNIGAPGDDAAIQRGDKWLKDNLAGYIDWAQSHNSLFILTYDEDNFTKENQIPTLFVGPMVKQGKYNTEINHYNVLHTLEAMYNLPVEDNKSAEVISGIWKTSAK